jgi:hypothetical protein
LEYFDVAGVLRGAPEATGNMLLCAVEMAALTHLDLTKAAVDVAEGQSELLGQSPAHLRALRSLTWAAAPPAALARIGLHLAALTALSRVDLQDTDLSATPEGWDVTWLALLAGSLRALSLRNTRLFGAKNTPPETALAKHADIVAHLAACTRLDHLNLSANVRSDVVAGESVLAAIIAPLRALRTLKLRAMGLSPAQFELLAPAIAELAHLSSLDLGKNDKLGTASVKLLAEHAQGLMGLGEVQLDGLPLACARDVPRGSVVRSALGGCDCTRCDQHHQRVADVDDVVMSK